MEATTQNQSAANDIAPLFVRPVGCWTERQAAQFALALIMAGLPFKYVGKLPLYDGTISPTFDFLFRASDYARVGELAFRQRWKKQSLGLDMASALETAAQGMTT
jgi:hypothetical protein